MTTLERELEEAVVDAWPASETAELDGWLLRASGGPTHRGNSGATLAAGHLLNLETRLERAEAWYRERGKVPMFQVGPCAAPPGLDAALHARGYQKEGEAVMALASAAEVARRAAAKPAVALFAAVANTPDAAWLAVAAGASRFAANPEIFHGFLARLGARCRFVASRDERGNVAAACLGITSESRLGIYAMFALPAFRRRGAARAMLQAAAEHAAAQNTQELYLLVERSNTPARALYASCGFRDVYGYHYRSCAAGAAAQP